MRSNAPTTTQPTPISRQRATRSRPRWGPWAAVIMVVLVGILGYGITLHFGTSAALARSEQQAQQLSIQVAALQSREQALRGAISASGRAPAVNLTENEVRELVVILFPAEVVDRFMGILRCENERFDPQAVHINDPGRGVDVGLAMINSIYRTKVERLFREPYEVAMMDPVKNLVFARVLYGERGFQPWTCGQRR